MTQGKSAPQNAVTPPHQAGILDGLVADPAVAMEFGNISLMTLYRWTNDPTLGFPPPIKIRTKNFRSRRALDDFKARLMRDAISKRAEAR
jgi:hypothetical protein